MPVGKVFDAAANQVLISPVSNFYQGKAIRQQLAAGEKELEQADERLDLERRRVAVGEDNAATARRKFEAEVGADRAVEYAKDLYSRVYSIDEAVTAGEIDEAGAMQMASESFAEYAASLPEKYAVPIAEMLQDGITIDEYRQIKASAAGALNDYGLLESDGGGDSPFSKINPKDYTPESIAEFQKTGNMASLRAREDTSSSRQRDDEIAAATAMLRNAGIPNAEEEATKVVDGIVTYTPDPSGGSIYRIDKLKGTAQEINIQSGVDRGDRPQVPAEGTLWNLAKDATGPIPTMAAGASKASGAAGGPISEKVVSARQKFKAAENDVIRAFSLNPRYPVAEQNRIKENIAITPTFFDSEGLMQARMRSIDAFLKEKLALLEWEIKRPGIDKKQRAEDEKTIAGIKGFLDTLGAPSADSIPQVQNDEDYNALPSGTVFIDPDGVKRTKP